MKKIFTIVFASISIAAAAQVSDAHAGHNHGAGMTVSPASQSDVVKPAPVVDEALFLKELAFDFGKIPQGKPVTHIFTVVNKGKDSLRIANVQASCGCTTPQWEQNKAVAPGASTDITVGYNAAAAGAFTKFITITYNGTQSKQIQISGEVWATPPASAPEAKKADNGM